MLPLMVSRLPLGAGTLLDVKRAARVIDGGAWTAGLQGWTPLEGRQKTRPRTIPARSDMTLRVREPLPEASPRVPRQKLTQQRFTAPRNAARSHDKKRTRRACLGQRNGRNSSPYLEEILSLIHI